MEKAKALIALGFALVFSGCLQEDIIENRLLCIELSSVSFTSIPSCDSQEDCVKEFDESFSLKTEELNQFVQNQLFEFKNRVALSWLYLNSALEKAEKINAACSSGNGLESLDVQVNELNFSVSKAFEEIEKAHEIAFSIVFLEKADLEAEDIFLVKEEDLFNDFSALSNAGVSISEQSPNESNFASLYFSNYEKFHSLAKNFGFEERVLKETTVFDVAGFFDDRLSKFLPKEPFFVPLLSSAYFKVFEYFTDAFEISRSVSFLESMPSFELFDSFNWFAGTESSSVKEFAILMNSDNFHRQTLSEKNSLLENDIESGIFLAEEKISLIDDTTYSSFDQNFLQELAELSEFSATIVSDKYGISSLSELKNSSSMTLAEIKTRFNDLKAQDVISEISLGKKTSTLKEIKSDVLLLSGSIDFYSNEVVTGLKNACSERIPVIEEKTNNESLQNNPNLSSFAAGIMFKAAEFKKETQTVPSLVLCKEIVEQFNTFQNALENAQVFEDGSKSIAGECMKELEGFFSKSPPGFFDLKEVFESLNAVSPSLEAESLAQKCLDLKEKTLSSLNSLEGAKKTIENHAQTQKMLSSLQKIASVDPKNPSKESFESLSKKISGQEGFFEGQGLALSAYGVLSELEATSFSLLAETKEALYVAVKALLEKNVSVEVFSDDKIVAGKQSVSSIKISSTNPIEQFDFPVTFSVNGFEFFEPLETFRSPNVSGFSLDGKMLSIDLNFVPLGSSVLVLEDKKTHAEFSEKILPISVSLTKAFFEKQLTIDADGLIKELEVSTTLPDNYDVADTFVYFKGESVSFEKTPSGVSFSLVDVSDNSVASVFFTVSDPVSVEVKNTQTLQVDSNSFDYFFFLEIKNSLDFELKNIKIFVPVPVTGNDFSIKRATGLGGQKITVEKHSLGNVLVSIESLAPQEKKDVLLEVSVKNYSGFWEEFIEGLEAKLSTLALSTDKSVSENAKTLSEELAAIKIAGGFEDSSAVEELLELSLQVQSLSEQSESFEKSMAAVLGLKEGILSQISFLEENAALLKELGFESDAQKLLLQAQKAKNSLESVNESLPTAAELLLSIKSSLSQEGNFSASGFILSETEKLVTEANEILSLEKDFKMVFAGKEDVFDAQKNVSFYLNNNDFLGAGVVLEELKNTVANMNGQALEKAATILKDKKALFEEFESLAREIPSKADELKRLQKEFEEKISGYFFPTTLDRIEKLLLSFNSFSLETVSESFGEMTRLESDGNVLGAAKIALKASKEAEKALLELRKIDKEFSSDLSQLREDAFGAYYLAELKAKNAANAEATALLFDAKQKLENGQLADAILLSKKVEEVLANQKFIDLNIPVAVYPIVLLVVVGMYFRHRQKNKPVLQKTKVERVKAE